MSLLGTVVSGLCASGQVEVDRWGAMRRPERHSLEIVACCRSPAAFGAKPPRGDLSLPPTSALVEYRSTSRPSASAQRTSSPSRSPPRARPGWSTWARPRDRRSATEHGRGRHRTGASFDAAAGLLHERLIAPLLAASGHGGVARHRPDGALSALPFEALSDGCGKRLASRLPRDRNAVIRRRPRTLGLAMRRTRRGLQPLPSKWSARRKASATIVNVGFRLPAVGNTELPAT